MANDKLPTPATAQDMYNNAIVTELRVLNRNIGKLVDVLTPAAAPRVTGDNGIEVLLKEPEQPKTQDSKKATAKGK